MVTKLIFLCILSIITVIGNPLTRGMQVPICPALIQDESTYRNSVNLPIAASQPTIIPYPIPVNIENRLKTLEPHTIIANDESHHLLPSKIFSNPTNIPYPMPVNIENRLKTLEPHTIIANDESHHLLLSKILSNPVIRSIIDPFSSINNVNGNGGPNIVNNYIIVPSDYLKLNDTREKSRRAKVSEGVTNRFNRKELKVRKNKGFGEIEPSCLPDVFLDVLDIDPGLRPKCQRESPMETKLKLNTQPICNFCGPFDFDFVEENERRLPKREQNNVPKNAKRKKQNNLSVRNSNRRQYKLNNRERIQNQQSTVPARNIKTDTRKGKPQKESNRKPLLCSQCPNPRSEIRSNIEDMTRKIVINGNNTPERYKPLNMGNPYALHLNNFGAITDNSLATKQTEDAVVRDFLKMYPNVPDIVARSLLSYMSSHLLRHPNPLYSPSYSWTYENPHIFKNRGALRKNKVLYNERPGTKSNNRSKTRIRVDSSKSNVPIVELYPGFLEIGPVNIGKVDPIKEHTVLLNPLLAEPKQVTNMQQIVAPEAENLYRNEDILPPYLATYSENPDASLDQEDAVPVVYENYIIEDYYPNFTVDQYYPENDEDSEYENGSYYSNFETDKDLGRYERHDSKRPSMNENKFYNDEGVISNHQSLHDDYRILPLDTTDFRTTKVSNLVTNDVHPIYDDPGKNEVQGSLKSNQYKNNGVETVYANSKVVVYSQDSPEGISLMT